jgi:hypothetical protein
MDFQGLDIADKKTPAREEGGDVSTRHIYKHLNTFNEIFLSEIDELQVVLASTDMEIPNKKRQTTSTASFLSPSSLVGTSIRSLQPRVMFWMP